MGVSGAHTPLAEFHARQTRRGVSAAPWGQRRVFPHTFVVEKFGGQGFTALAPSEMLEPACWSRSRELSTTRAFEQHVARTGTFQRWQICSDGRSNCSSSGSSNNL